ncbi:MAG: PspA/IM30 family protein [Acidimicrobiales bacterium]
MSVFRRMSQVFQQKANAALDKAEDPAQALDLSYQKMMENLSQIRRSIADVVTSQKRLEAQRAQIQNQYDKLQGQARQALQQGQEDLAKQALARAQALPAQIAPLDQQISVLQTQAKNLEETGRQTQAKVEQFRAQRDTMKAQYTAAKASTQAMESISGLSEQMSDVNLMLDRAKDKVAQMQARSEAVTELSNSGVLDAPSFGGPTDDIEAQLAAGSPMNDVNYQLEQMKAELAAGSSQAAPATPKEPQTAVSPPPVPSALNAANSIVIRIAGEGRYRIPTSLRPALEGLDTAMEVALNTNDETSFTKCAHQLVKLIKESGTPVPDEDLTASDLVVPGEEMSIAEASTILSGDGNNADQPRSES